jgi:hypothetical protein
VDLSPRDSVIDSVCTEGNNCSYDEIQLKNGIVIQINEIGLCIFENVDDAAVGSVLYNLHFKKLC